MRDELQLRLRDIVEQFFGFVGEDAESLLEELETVDIRGGDWLMRQGDPADSLYFVVRGRLQVWAEPKGTDTAREPRLLGEIAPGESVGEIGLITGGVRTAGIRAIRDSQLLRLGRAAFERFAADHPGLMLQLAGSVARRLTERTSLAPAAARNLATVALLPLDDAPWFDEFTRDLARQLTPHGPTLRLGARDLGEHGAPVADVGGTDRIPDTLKHWLDVQESEQRFLLYVGEAGDTAWSRLCVRQADLVLLVADAREAADPRAWEASLLESDASLVARRALVLVHPAGDESIRDTARWLAGRHTDFHLNLRAGDPGETARLGRLLSGESLGLVLGGGAARGFAEIGVYKAICEAGLPVDWVGGTSIGGIIGAAIASFRDPEQVIEASRDAFVRGRPFGDFTLPVLSVLRGKRMERLTKHHLSGNIEDLAVPYFCVSSLLDRGTIHVHEHGPLWTALRATAALPGMLPPAVVQQRLAVDGAVLNNLPVDIMRTKPVGKVIAVDVSSRRTYRVEYDELPSPWAVLRGRLLPFGRRHRVPSLISVLLKSTEIGTMAKVRELGEQADLLLRPPVSGFGMTDVKSYDRIVQAGYEHACERLDEWLSRDEREVPLREG